MTIVSVSLTHRVTPTELLEKLAATSAPLSEVLVQLRSDPAIDEVVILSTCNRMEVYASTCGSADEVTAAAVDILAGRALIAIDDIRPLVRVRVGLAAVEHIFAVACGLDSMAIGEDQIVAQIRGSIRLATEASTIGAVLTSLLNSALRVSKRARTDTTISTAGISLARTGLDLARSHLNGLAGRHAVILGAGSVGSLAARLLFAEGAGRISVAGRSEVRAARVAAAVSGRVLKPGEFPAVCADADVLVTATGSTLPVVLADELRAARAGVARRPLFVLDLGMPRDVEPAVGDLHGVTLVDIDGLGKHLAGHDVPDALDRVRDIVAIEAAAHVRRRHEVAVGPVIHALRTHIREVTQAELERLDDRLPDLSERQRAETAATVHRIAGKLLHGPTVRVKEFTADSDGPLYLEVLRRLFDLDLNGAKAS